MLQFQQQLFFPIGLRNRGIPIRYTSLFCQWGATNASGAINVTFPMAFTSAVYSIVTTTYNSENWGCALNSTKSTFTAKSGGSSYWVALGQ